MYLDNKLFENIVRFSPLSSIDLCILNDTDEILLGKRINPPAKNFFFVPGGRVRKDERLFSATNRILKSELNHEISLLNFNKLDLLGVFQHFYEDNFTGNKLFSSHYIVTVYLVPLKVLNKSNTKIFKDQHDEYIWYDKTKSKELLIHPYCKEYIKKL